MNDYESSPEFQKRAEALKPKLRAAVARGEWVPIADIARDLQIDTVAAAAWFAFEVKGGRVRITMDERGYVAS